MTDTENATFSVDVDARTVRGLLLPFGEKSRVGTQLKTEPVYFTPDSITLPEDPSAITLNREHDQFKPLGRATLVEKRPEGVYAEFSIARTADGDKFLTEDYPKGTLRKLSAEVLGLTRDAADKAKALGASLTGAAACRIGSFESAALFSIVEHTEDEFTDEQGTTWRRVTDSETETEQDKTTTTTTVVEEVETPGDPAEEEGSAVGVPNTLAASAANLVAPEGEEDKKGAREVFSLMAEAMQGDEDARKALFALTDIKTTATNGSLGNVIQPNWLGEVWKQKSYVRRYMPLILNGSITSQDEKGYTVSAGTEPVQPWSGNKTAVPSSSGSTNLLSSTFQRWGWAADIAREFFDIPGNTEVIDAFLRLVNNSYARQTDKWTLAQIVASATTVAPETYPALPSGAKDYPVAVKQLIQGVDAVSADPVDDTPAFAIVNTAAWKQIIYTPQDSLPNWMKLSFGIQTQDGSADGNVRVVRGDIGIANTPAVLVGAKDAAHVNELGGESPLNLSALDIANGGIDRSVIGYTQYMAEYAAALIRVGVADS